MPNPKYDEEGYLVSGSTTSESSSESKLRSGATSRESYSEQKLRKGAKPVAKAKEKPKAKPVVGRAGAQTPSQRAKLVPSKSPDEARARNAARPVKKGTPMRPTKPVGDKGMDARLAAKKSAAAPKAKTNNNPYGGFSMAARALGGKGKTNTQTAAFKADQAKLKKAYDIAQAKKGK